MKRIKTCITLFICILCATLSVSGCSSQSKQPQETTPPEQMSSTFSSPDEISSINFNPNYKAIETIMDNIDQGENTMYSPLSLNFALGMINNGATEDVKTDFEKYFNTDIETYNNFSKNLIKQNDGVLKIANSIWVRNDYTLNKNFKKQVEKYYDAESKTLPFDEDFVTTLNKWCDEKTDGLISEILKEPPVDNTKMLIANALYFNGEWETKYNKEAIRNTDFNTFNQTVKTEGMHSKEDIYLENENATGFIKYYKSKKYAFVGILPKKDGNFTFKDLDLKTLMDSKKYEDVHTMIPKFKFDSSLKLTDQLPHIGLEKTTIPNSFPNIVNETPLKVGTVFQKTTVNVNEKGTEASAVTIITMHDNGVQSTPSKEVYLNRPFAFMIYDVENNTPVFVGKVINPTQ